MNKPIGTAWVLGTLLALALPAGMQAHDYQFETNNGAITITKYSGAGEAVTIPDKLNGLPVISIGDSASGVAPWVLKDSKARTEYVAAIRANAERANIGNKIISAQNDLRSLRSIVVWELRCYLERAYTFSESDRQEWSDILSRSALPEARQKEFNDLFHKKNP